MNKHLLGGFLNNQSIRRKHSLQISGIMGKMKHIITINNTIRALVPGGHRHPSVDQESLGNHLR